MSDQARDAIKELLVTLQVVKLYGLNHSIAAKAIDNTFSILQDYLNQRDELVFGIIGEELAFEKEIFFDLSKHLKQMITYFKDRGIERIAINSSLRREELARFLGFLVMPKDEIKQDLAESLLSFGIKNISIGRVKGSIAGADKSTGPAVNLDIYQGSLNKLSGSLEGVLNKEAVEGQALRNAVSSIFDNLSTNYQELLKLVTLKRYDAATFVHLLNVSILSMFFSSKLGFTKEIVMDIGLSALLHDMGKLYVSRKIINKPGELNSLEFDQMESHSFLGAKLLMRYVDNIGIMPVVVSFEHHLKYDLSGYPKVIFKRKQHIASSIVSICDVYDALCARRSYKSDYPPDMIYSLMMRGRQSAFDPALLDSFFKIMGVWPLGSIISLSDKRVGVVVATNEDDINLPVVKIISSQGSDELINLKERKDIKIERYINSMREGKEFLHLV